MWLTTITALTLVTGCWRSQTVPHARCRVVAMAEGKSTKEEAAALALQAYLDK